MTVTWGHASLTALATLVTWSRKSCSTVRPGEASHLLESSPSPSRYTWRQTPRHVQQKVSWVHQRPTPTSSAPMCSVLTPGCSSTTCRSISSTTFTASSLWGFRVPRQCGTSLRCSMDWCFRTNCHQKRTSHFLTAAAWLPWGAGFRLTSMWPNVCTSGITSRPADLAQSCRSNTSSRLKTEQEASSPSCQTADSPHNHLILTDSNTFTVFCFLSSPSISFLRSDLLSSALNITISETLQSKSADRREKQTSFQNQILFFLMLLCLICVPE